MRGQETLLTIKEKHGTQTPATTQEAMCHVETSAFSGLPTVTADPQTHSDPSSLASTAALTPEEAAP